MLSALMQKRTVRWGRKTNSMHKMFIANSSGGGVAGTLDSSYYKGQGLRQGIEREYLVVGIVSSLYGEKPNTSAEAERLQRSNGGDI